MKYVSKKRELCLIMKPTDRSIDEQRRIIIHPGKRVEFFAGRYETKDPEIMEFMHNHPLRGTKFFEITETDDAAVRLAQQQATAGPKISTGAVDTKDQEIQTIIEADLGKVEVLTRPTDTTAISPELVKIIDERISAALETIVNLLKTDAKKEEAIMAGKPTKSFRCPYCGVPQPSGFAVGRHKKVCEKRPE